MRIATIIISLLLCGCSKATRPEYEEVSTQTVEKGLVTIDYLKSLASGRSTLITKDLFIEGYVVANDWLDEFYKTIVIAGDTGGIEIEIDKNRLYQTIPLHTLVTVSCNGLALGRVGGKITLGAPPTGEYATDRIAAADIGRYIKLSDKTEMPDPLELAVGELSVEHVSRLVCFRNMRIIDEELGKAWCDPESDEEDTESEDAPFLTYSDRHFRDADGNILRVRILNRCRYRDEIVPSGSVTLAGVVDYFDGDYALRITNHYIF